MSSGLTLALALWFRRRGWRSVRDDPPPIGLPVLGHCNYTGVRSVTARRDDIYFRQWDHWHINPPTHWRHLPDALARVPAPPPLEPLYVSTKKG